MGDQTQTSTEKLRAIYDDLTDYLMENTEEVFEEIPEIDDVRTYIDEMLYEMASRKAGETPHV